jgi:hypothetical protein
LVRFAHDHLFESGSGTLPKHVPRAVRRFVASEPAALILFFAAGAYDVSGDIGILKIEIADYDPSRE